MNIFKICKNVELRIYISNIVLYTARGCGVKSKSVKKQRKKGKKEKKDMIKPNAVLPATMAVLVRCGYARFRRRVVCEVA